MQVEVGKEDDLHADFKVEVAREAVVVAEVGEGAIGGLGAVFGFQMVGTEEGIVASIVEGRAGEAGEGFVVGSADFFACGE